MKKLKQILNQLFDEKDEEWKVKDIRKDSQGHHVTELESQIREKIIFNTKVPNAYENSTFDKSGPIPKLKKYFIKEKKPKYFIGEEKWGEEKESLGLDRLDTRWIMLDYFYDTEIKKDNIGYHTNFQGKKTCSECNRRIFGESYIDIAELANEQVVSVELGIHAELKCKSCMRQAKVAENL